MEQSQIWQNQKYQERVQSPVGPSTRRVPSGYGNGRNLWAVPRGVDTAIGAQVGDVQRGEAQAALATTGTYSGFQQEAARKAAAEQTAKTAQVLSQYKKQQQQGAMARHQAVSAGLQYERNERRKDRQAAMAAVTAVSDMLATHGEVGAEALQGVGEIIPM